MPTINVNQTNASETAKGIVEEATQAETNAGTDTGGTGAKVFIAPSKLISLLGSYLTTAAAASTYLTIVTAASTYQTTSGLFASVMGLVLTGFSAGANTAVSATDTLAQALAKFQGQINARATTSALTSHTSDTANPHATTATQVGLGNVDNTSDANKPVSTAQQTALNLKANLASPTLTGTPAAPTASAGTNTTQIATTAFVTTAVVNKPEFFGVAMSDETTVLAAASTSVPRVTIHAPYAMTLTRVYAGLTTAGTGASNCIVDIHVNGTTIMSVTKILFSASTKLSADGTLSTTAVAAGDLIEFFLDQRDTNNVAAGLKCYIIGHQ